MAGHRLGRASPKPKNSICAMHKPFSESGLHASSFCGGSFCYIFWHTGPVILVLFCIYISLGRLDSGLTIKLTMETRWTSSRADAVNVVAKKLSADSLPWSNSLKETFATTRSDASLILDSVLSFLFISFLSLWKSVLPEVNDAQKYLQAKGLDLQQSSVKLTALRECLLQNREEMVDSAKNSALKWG